MAVYSIFTFLCFYFYFCLPRRVLCWSIYTERQIYVCIYYQRCSLIIYVQIYCHGLYSLPVSRFRIHFMVFCLLSLLSLFLIESFPPVPLRIQSCKYRIVEDLFCLGSLSVTPWSSLFMWFNTLIYVVFVICLYSCLFLFSFSVFTGIYCFFLIFFLFC